MPVCDYCDCRAQPEIAALSGHHDIGIDPDYVVRFEDEHRRIEELLARAARERSAVGPLIELVEDHILREETDMFPAARQLVDPDEWDAVDQRVAQSC